MRTDKNHVLINHYILSPQLERFRESVLLHCSTSHTSVSQLKETENSHLLKNSNCKFNIGFIYVSTQSTKIPPKVYNTTEIKQSSIYDFKVFFKFFKVVLKNWWGRGHYNKITDVIQSKSKVK